MCRVPEVIGTNVSTNGNYEAHSSVGAPPPNTSTSYQAREEHRYEANKSIQSLVLVFQILT